MAACTNPVSATLNSHRIEGRIWDAPAPIRFWHLASLDAPTVALVWSYAFAWAAGVRLSFWAPAVLALIAWAVYIGDRLLDARAGLQSPPLHRLRDRHYFHWRYRWIMAPAGLLAAAAAAGLVFTRLPSGARLPDTAVAAATLAYFSGVHARGRLWRLVERVLSPFSSRAFWIGVLFTAGCLLPLASQDGSVPLTRQIAMPTLFFAALAWLNCHAIGKWESARSKSAGCDIVLMALVVAAAGALLGLALAPVAPRSAWLLATGSASALLFVALDRMRPRLTPLALRAAADLILLTPIFLLVLNK